MIPITIKQIETFIAVADARGFRRASERLNLSQSAVTAHIQQLESTLGVPLFHRTTRSVRLTQAGNDLLERARRTLTDLDDTVRTFRDEVAMTRGRVLVACAPSFASSILPPALAAFQNQYPEIFIQVREAYGSEIIEAIRNNTVDFGIGPLERDDKDITFTHILSDGFVAVLAGNHPLASKKKPSLPIFWASLFWPCPAGLPHVVFWKQFLKTTDEHWHQNSRCCITRH